MTMGEPEEGRKPACYQCGGVDGLHDDGCSERPLELAPSVSFALAIAHTPWIPERVESYERLRKELHIHTHDPESPAGVVGFNAITERAGNEVWSESMWRWAVASVADWCLFLQDDVKVAPTFWGALKAIVEALPAGAEVVGLEVVHPMAQGLCNDDVRLFSTSDCLIGVGYAIKRAALEDFLRWRDEQLVDGWKTGGQDGKTALHEDTMLGIWCLVTGRRIWHPLPTIIDHDTDIPSTYGNDAHTSRRPPVRWDAAEAFADEGGPRWDAEILEGAGYWLGRCRTMRLFAPDGTPLGTQRAHSTDPQVLRGRGRTPHLGRFYSVSPHVARRWVKGFTDAMFRAALADQGAAEQRRIVYGMRARGVEAKDRVLVCTPTKGGVDIRFVASTLQLCAVPNVETDIVDAWLWTDDLVRVRSRFVRAMLETDATALYFRDADTPAPGMVLAKMLASGHQFVAAPYPRRDGLDWTKVRQAVKDGAPVDFPLEAAAYRYTVGFLPGQTELTFDAHDCTEVAHVPLGCALIRRKLLEHMVEYYEAVDRGRVDFSVLKDDVRAGLGRLSRPKLEQLVVRMGLELQNWRAGVMGLRFLDLHQGLVFPTVALFQLFVDEHQVLESEDASFCYRVRRAGGKVHLYLGPGSPVDHVGDHVYAGKLEAFGLARAAP